jgi:dTDP-4-dehydrorhamnose 3,5-epimerase
MLFRTCEIAGAWVVEPQPLRDERGYFVRAWCRREFEDHGIEFAPLQANMGFSRRKGTIRGLHYQVAPAIEAKLVRCTRGSLFDVVVDIRPESPTYRAWHGTTLSAENGCMLFVPEGCAHGYQTLVDDTEMHYMTSAFYAPNEARGARYDDPAFAIHWPLPPGYVSAQDRSWPLIGEPDGSPAAG